MNQKLLAGFFILFFIVIGASSAHATSDLAIAGSTSLSGTVGVAMPVTGLQITGTTPSSTPVKLFVSNGTLTLGTTTGLTFTSGGASGSALYFTGTLTDINNALATLTYTRGSAGTDTLEVSLVNNGEVFFPDNGHLYKFITGTIDWNSAHTAAASQTAYGSTGYLTTITSANENTFISARMVADGWIGASDSAIEGDWKWVTGPETGTSFWSGLGSGGSSVGGNYSNWNSGEPNDSGGNEDCAEYYSASGRWNDLPCSGTTLTGYMVEFGASGDLPTVVAQNIAITTSSLPALSSTTPADNATNIDPSANLVMNFTQAVTVDTGNILIKKTSDDSTVETISVTSGLVTGSGTSTITINPANRLDDSTGYYITIPGTAFKNVSNAYYAGITLPTTWNFTTGDYTPPTITSITTTTPDGAYTIGRVITTTVTFSEPITSTGLITLTFETGATDRTCTFTVTNATSGSCIYTVQAGDTSSDLSATVSGVILDQNLNTLINFIPTVSLEQASDIVIDTTAPTLTEVTPVASPAQALTVSYYFSSTEPGTYTVSSCGNGAQTSVNAGSSVGISNLTFGTDYSCDFSLTDAAGNVSNTLHIAFSVYVPQRGRPALSIAQANQLAAAVNATTNVQAPTTTNSMTNGSTSSGSIPLFEIDMKKGSTINDVSRLQEFLKSMGPEIYPEGIVSGYFGPLTYNAVVRFQEKYTADVLTPINTTKGTGNVLKYTRKKLNDLLLHGGVVL